jgi:hypothetical protein
VGQNTHKKATLEIYGLQRLPLQGGQKSMKQFMVNPAEKTEAWNKATANRLLSLWIATSALPLSLCESAYGRAFLSYISKGEYSGVTHPVVTETLRRIELKEIMPALKALLGSLDSLSCTTDFWTDIHRRPMAAVTGHYIDRTRKLRRVLLAMEPFEGNMTGFCMVVPDADSRWWCQVVIQLRILLHGWTDCLRNLALQKNCGRARLTVRVRNRKRSMISPLWTFILYGVPAIVSIL